MDLFTESSGHELRKPSQNTIRPFHNLHITVNYNMSLNASLSAFKTELSTTAARNIAHSRPASATPARTTTPKTESSKRTHGSAFSAPPPAIAATTNTIGHAGREVLTQVFNSVAYLKEKSPNVVPFDQLIGYLSLPNDAAKNVPHIKKALQGNDRAEYFTKAESGNGRESFKYRPLHPVTNGEELTAYLARQPTAQGIPVKDLKDGWPDCNVVIDSLEKKGEILVVRNKKDDTPKCVWTDSPSYHILSQPLPPDNKQVPQKADADFVDVWAKTKLPPSEQELRSELEKAGLTPTSAVKEVNRVEAKKKEKRRINRKGGKTTNSHMLGILKDYTKK